MLVVPLSAKTGELDRNLTGIRERGFTFRVLCQASARAVSLPSPTVASAAHAMVGEVLPHDRSPEPQGAFLPGYLVAPAPPHTGPQWRA